MARALREREWERLRLVVRHVHGLHSLVPDQQSLVVEVRPVERDTGLLRVADQEERHADVVFREQEPPEGFHQLQRRRGELELDLEMK